MTLFSFINKHPIYPSNEKKIIPAKEFSELLEAHAIVRKAQEEAELYKAQTYIECEALKKTAHEEGFKEGLENFNTHLIHFDKQLHLIRMDLQRQILPLALKAAKKIVAEQLSLAPETIVDIVIQAIAPAVQNQRFTLYVNKADKELLELQRGKIKEILEQVQTLAIVERSDIAQGGCIIETESGIINATIENQWRSMEAAFEKYMKT